MIRFLSYNILDGGRGREQELAQIISAQNADVVLLQEVIEKDFVVELAAQLQSECIIAESNSGRTIALLSRLKIAEFLSFRPPILRHTCLRATLEYAPRQTLELFGIHLAAPAYTFPVEMYRLRELRAILEQVAGVQTGNIILAGDFNSMAPSDAVDLRGLPWRVRAEIVLQGGLIARQVVGKIRKQGFVDGFRELHPHENGFTLPAGKARVRLDYFFLSHALVPGLRACSVVTEPEAVKHASDHLPVQMELAL